ncbi:putative uncharacterized protein MSANTD5 [Sorex araneus]|uniref:putative uncharacterized protein MSANTD5 n=1 Tax=Sorex araneus TaxID=42254 RepID=UPI002433F589|nr:putative uncharacterized protein MSANTD5 [Sorex araneus]
MAAETTEMLMAMKSDVAEQSQEDQQEAAAAPKPLGPQAQPWSGDEIRCFIREWELLGDPRGRKDIKTAKAIAQRLRARGILRSRKQCLCMLENLREMYWTVHRANQRPRAQPLPCPFGEALHRLLGPGGQHPASDPPSECGVRLAAPGAQAQAWGPPAPFEGPLWTPPPVIEAPWTQLPVVPAGAQWVSWQPGHPAPAFWFPPGLPAFVPLGFVPPMVSKLPAVPSPSTAPSPLKASSPPNAPSSLTIHSPDGPQPLDGHQPPVALSLPAVPAPQ